MLGNGKSFLSQHFLIWICDINLVLVEVMRPYFLFQFTSFLEWASQSYMLTLTIHFRNFCNFFLDLHLTWKELDYFLLFVLNGYLTYCDISCLKVFWVTAMFSLIVSHGFFCQNSFKMLHDNVMHFRLSPRSGRYGQIEITKSTIQKEKWWAIAVDQGCPLALPPSFFFPLFWWTCWLMK